MKIFRTAFLLTGLTLLLLLLGSYFGGRSGMTVALGFAIVMNSFAYFFSDKIALWSSGAEPVTREEVPRLYEVVEGLAAKANLPVPKLYVIPEPAPNAFATGRNPRHASVAVTQGLLQIMDNEELEGVIAHELSHVRNYDILISSIAATIAGDSDDDPGSARRHAIAVGDLTSEGVCRRRDGRSNGRASLRFGPGARKARRLQQSHSHNDYLAIHVCPLHCETPIWQSWAFFLV